jgi:hypothetical protein
MALDDLSAPNVGTEDVQPSFGLGVGDPFAIGLALEQLVGSLTLGPGALLLKIPALQAQSSGVLYAREVMRLSPQFGYLAITNTFYKTHSITSWGAATIVWNAIRGSVRGSSTDPVWSTQAPLPPPPLPPGGQPPVTTGPPPPIGGPPVTITPQPGPPPAFPMPCQPMNDPDQDEVGRMQDCLAANLATIAGLLNQLIQQGYAPIGGGSGGLSPDCCQELVSAITAGLAAVATAISSASTASGPGGQAPDLTPVVTALLSIATALQGYPAIWQALATAVGANLTSIATAIAGIPATDVSGIVAQLAKLYKTIDVPMAVYEDLAANGYISSGDLQLLGTGELGAGLVNVFRKWAWNAFVWLIGWAGIVYDGKRFRVLPLGETVANDIAGPLKAALQVGSDPLYPVVKGLVDAVVAQITPAAPPPLGSPGLDSDALLAKTLAPAFIINGVMLIAGYLGWELSEQLREYVDLTTAFVGLEEVREFKVGALLREGIVAAAHMQARRLYRQHLPGAGELADWVARGLVPQNAAAVLMQLNGVSDDLQPTVFAAAYSGMQPRQLIRLIETGLFTTDDIKDELTFRGMRPASQARMLLAVPYLATQTQRSQLISALESAYAAGLLADADYTARVDSAWQNSDRDSLALAAAQLRKLVKLAADLETEYTTLYKATLIDDADFRSYLSGIGLQPDYVNAVAGKAEAAANATLQRGTIAAAKALARTTASEERKAAMKGFATGTLDLAGLSAALLLTGLTATQSAAWSALAELQKQGSLRWLYGLQLSPAQATQLRARVTALTDQRKRLQIDAATYDAQLKALGIGDAWRNALEATADAMITPKSSAFAIPVSTS